jgi:uncharacterized repeat protein (TIGR03833 family)
MGGVRERVSAQGCVIRSNGFLLKGEKMVPKRIEIQVGMRVLVVEKQNQPTGRLTEGIVARILTSSPNHPHGIKVMLTNGKVGRVQSIVSGAA